MSWPTTPSDNDRSWRYTVFALAALVVCAGVGIGAVLLTGALEKDHGPSHPDHWDPRVEKFVKVVERERDLDFVHPIYVDFLTDDEFRDEVTRDEEELSDEDRKEFEQTTGLLRAVGLIEGDVDLFEANNDLSGAGILGYYSYDDERIRIRGDHLTPARRTTLVHELTHALQDQYFNLGTHFAAFEESEDDEKASAFRALVEGDARRVEAAYTKSLTGKQQAAIRKEERGVFRKYQQEVTDVPQIMQTMSATPYDLGEAMLRLAVALDGNDEVDDLFRDPPSSDEQLLDPWALLADDDDPRKVPEPALEAGEEKFDDGQVGAVMWYYILAQRLPLLKALDAVDGWGGDSMVAFDRDGVSCLRADVEGDSFRQLSELRDALASWIAARPAGSASVKQNRLTLRFESCDPGKAAHIGPDASQRALTLALTRTYLAASILDSGAGEKVSRCFADRFVHTFRYAQILDPDFGRDDPALQARFRAIAESCR